MKREGWESDSGLPPSHCAPRGLALSPCLLNMGLALFSPTFCAGAFQEAEERAGPGIQGSAQTQGETSLSQAGPQDGAWSDPLGFK